MVGSGDGFCFCGDGCIVMVVSVTASIRVAVKISTKVFNCMFCGGICCLCSGSGGSDISWILIAFVVMVGYRWSS